MSQQPRRLDANIFYNKDNTIFQNKKDWIGKEIHIKKM